VQHALKNSQDQAGYNSQRQVSHINDGTWTAKMNVNTVNPFLPHGVEYARQSAHLPKHLQVQDSYQGTAHGQGQWKTAQADPARTGPHAPNNTAASCTRASRSARPRPATGESRTRGGRPRAAS
jgi:hypothetical protein